jgi:5-methylcytosine-specific restriction endonuclease McrA
MIRIRRAAEAEACPQLSSVRITELARVHEALRAGKETDQRLLGNEYKVARHALARGQHLKCCYCEDRLQDDRWEHVEHFRPKAEARRERSAAPEVGYWWLAWTWENLLFSCIRCNSAKGSLFPLLEGSSALLPEEALPGSERPLLIDPAGEDPREHVQFRRFGEHWLPGPRTPRGAAMLQAVDLGLEPAHEGHRVGLQQEWDDHAKRMQPAIEVIERALETNDRQRIRDAWEKHTKPYRVASQRFVALALDVLDHCFPDHVRRRWALELTVLYP